MRCGALAAAFRGLGGFEFELIMNDLVIPNTKSKEKGKNNQVWGVNNFFKASYSPPSFFISLTNPRHKFPKTGITFTIYYLSAFSITSKVVSTQLKGIHLLEILDTTTKNTSRFSMCLTSTHHTQFTST
jgi:hypothetical protein